MDIEWVNYSAIYPSFLCEHSIGKILQENTNNGQNQLIEIPF